MLNNSIRAFAGILRSPSSIATFAYWESEFIYKIMSSLKTLEKYELLFEKQKMIKCTLAIFEKPSTVHFAGMNTSNTYFKVS